MPPALVRAEILIVFYNINLCLKIIINVHSLVTGLYGMIEIRDIKFPTGIISEFLFFFLHI